ncbi:MAG: ornithine cyclodeaminase [Acidimicrobiaceae bacterium]|nr:ornithine cyclodeaminase [Acidimicrobiaceae bacterium]
MNEQRIDITFLSQEDLLRAGCFDMKMAIDTAEQAMLSFRRKEILFPEKIVQIFAEHTQDRINCLPATLLSEKVCGVKWVSVFPANPTRYGKQNLSAVFILSEIDSGFPVAFMEGTLASNMRVGAMGGVAAKYLSREDSKVIGLIGAGEQAKMSLAAIKAVRPTINECRVSAKTTEEEEQFGAEMQALYPDIGFVQTNNNGQAAMDGADILVTATSAQAPLLKAAWMKPGAFYNHVGGWEDEYAVAKQCTKIVCDDWETVKHRTQTISRMYKDGELADDDIYADLPDIITGDKPGRETDDERTYFNAVGLAYIDVAIALSMYNMAKDASAGQLLTLQEHMIFEHKDLKDWIQR